MLLARVHVPRAHTRCITEGRERKVTPVEGGKGEGESCSRGEGAKINPANIRDKGVPEGENRTEKTSAAEYPR